MSIDRAEVAAIVLAGGRASRVGGVDKTAFTIGERTLLDRALDATNGCLAVTVVGAERPTARPMTWVREDPPFGGPAAAIVAGLAASSLGAGSDAGSKGSGSDGPRPDGPRPDGARDPDDSRGTSGDTPWMLVLAADLPGVEAAVERLLYDAALLPHDTEGLCLADDSGRPQWLTGLYRTASLQRAATSLAETNPASGAHGASVRALLDDLAIAVVRAPESETRDVDTWEDLEWARSAATDASTPRTEREPDDE